MGLMPWQFAEGNRNAKPQLQVMATCFIEAAPFPDQVAQGPRKTFSEPGRSKIASPPGYEGRSKSTAGGVGHLPGPQHQSMQTHQQLDSCPGSGSWNHIVGFRFGRGDGFGAGPLSVGERAPAFASMSAAAQRRAIKDKTT